MCHGSIFTDENKPDSLHLNDCGFPLFTSNPGPGVSFFSKSKDNPSDSEIKRDPRKAKRFFEHAETVADAKNYDYAIELLINGLKHEPGNMTKHEALLDVAKRRKVSGGKPAGLRDKLKSSGSDPVSKMLDAEKIWAMNFTDDSLMTEVMKKAVEADQAEPELGLGEVAFWVGNMALDIAVGKPKAKKFIQLRDLFAQIGRYDKAIEACKRAIRLEPNNHSLMQDLKNLEAENYSATSTGSEEGSFRENIKDQEHAQEAAAGNTTAESAVDQAISRRRAEYEENPEDLDRLSKLVDALLKKEEFDSENEAIKLLNTAHEQSGQYRYRVRMGDIKMKQLTRELRQLKQFVDAAPDAEEYKDRYRETLKKRMTFELSEYQERVKNYPTDLKLKFELGKRLYQAKLIDEAIAMLQQAKSEPKSRSQAHLLLGRCFIEKEWFDEAIDTMRQGIEAHPVSDDAIGKEMRYELMVALLDAAERDSDADKAEEANSIASEILQADIGYKNIMEEKQRSAELMKKLKS